MKIDMISSSDVFSGLPSKSLKCFSFTRSSWLDTFNLDLLQQFFLPLTSLMIFHVTVAFCSSLCFWQVSSDSAADSLNAISKLLFVVFVELLTAESCRALNLFFNSEIKVLRTYGLNNAVTMQWSDETLTNELNNLNFLHCFSLSF